MKILFLTNLYPPHYIGGYEQLCMDVAGGLTAKGHDCHILTSTYGVGKQAVEGRVHRLLELEGEFYGKRRSFAESERIRVGNEKIVRQAIETIAPDLIFIWSMRRFSRSLLFLAEKIHRNVVYYITDNWLFDHYRPTRRNLRKYIQSYRYLLDRPRLQHVICSSRHIRTEMVENGIPIGHAHVVHNGVDLEPYLSIKRSDAGEPFRILYAGRLVPEKGPHTLLQALARLAATPDAPKLHLTLVGGGEESYLQELKTLCSATGIAGCVTFTGNLPREELPGYFASHDLFVFPSIWLEPFSLTLVMALASEIPVVGTLTGGSSEILRDRGNCLAFEAGDSVDLAAKLQLLLDNEELRKSLAKRGRQDSLSCTLPVMVDRVEAILKQVAESTAGQKPDGTEL